MRVLRGSPFPAARPQTLDRGYGRLLLQLLQSPRAPADVRLRAAEVLQALAADSSKLGMRWPWHGV